MYMLLQKLWTLFLSQLSISCLSFGGGLTITAMIRRRFVEELHWLDPQEMLDLTAIAQAAPGPSSCNTAVMVGYRICGLPGALVCAAASVIPPMALLMVVSALYEALRQIELLSMVLRFMQIGMAAYLVDICGGLAREFLEAKKAIPILMMLLCLAGRLFWGISVTKLFLFCLAAGAVDLLIHKPQKEVE